WVFVERSSAWLWVSGYSAHRYDVAQSESENSFAAGNDHARSAENSLPDAKLLRDVHRRQSRAPGRNPRDCESARLRESAAHDRPQQRTTRALGGRERSQIDQLGGEESDVVTAGGFGRSGCRWLRGRCR